MLQWQYLSGNGHPPKDWLYRSRMEMVRFGRHRGALAPSLADVPSAAKRINLGRRQYMPPHCTGMSSALSNLFSAIACPPEGALAGLAIYSRHGSEATRRSTPTTVEHRQSLWPM